MACTEYNIITSVETQSQQPTQVYSTYRTAAQQVALIFFPVSRPDALYIKIHHEFEEWIVVSAGVARVRKRRRSPALRICFHTERRLHGPRVKRYYDFARCHSDQPSAFKSLGSAGRSSRYGEHCVPTKVAT